MFNYKSPIVNNALGNGGMYNGYIPPQPIGNMLNIGGQGYNQQPLAGGFYNNMYNNYYNPYLAQQQEELRKAQEREAQNQQSSIWKTLSKNVNTALGNDVNEEYLSQHYDPIDYTTEKYVNNATYDRLMNLDNNGIYNDQRSANFIDANNRMYEQTRTQYPDDMGIVDFLAVAGELYADAIMRDSREKQKDLTQLYSSDKYKQLINVHSKGALSNNLGTNISLDDMEITLPNHIQNEYTARKAAFLNTILNKRG